jgi:murein tripeptide amidase MpaA
MPELQFNRFYRYDQLTQILQSIAAEYPHLVKLDSLGHSFEGRDIWLLRVTCFATGDDSQKPALWVDGNIHSVELAGSTACLYLLQDLVKTYGHDPEVTRCLDTRAFYICPRVNPDGAEWALADRPKFVRSSTRPYPEDERFLEGLQQQDIDGDGRILSMRVPDPNGAWKISSADPRLMVLREPTEIGGHYYRILREGYIDEYDGALIYTQPPRERLDLNRNFPAQWQPEQGTPGSGPYPTSEPEVRSLVQFISNHPNITAAIAFHTYGGLLMRPYSYQPDDALPTDDLRLYRRIGAQGTQLTEYPEISIYHDFRSDPKQVSTGALDDWAYEYRGIFAWTIEIWSVQRQAGITDYNHFAWYQEHPESDDLKLLHWNDEQLEGKGYVDWYPFEHPQLGPVELGGWDRMYAWWNPPPHLLEQEIARFPRWLVWHLLISPFLELYLAEALPLTAGVYRVRFVVQNTGWLPSYVTQLAQEKRLVQGCIGEIRLPVGATLVTGKQREEMGQLEGRAYKSAMPNSDPTRDLAQAEWMIQAAAGSTVQLIARHDRAGVVRTSLTLPEFSEQS